MDLSKFKDYDDLAKNATTEEWRDFVQLMSIVNTIRYDPKGREKILKLVKYAKSTIDKDISFMEYVNKVFEIITEN